MGGWDDVGTTSISSLNYSILLTFLSLLGELGSVDVKEGSPFLNKRIKRLFAGNEGFMDIYGWWASAIISSNVLLRWVFRWLFNDYSILYFLTTGQTSFHFLFINLFMSVCFALLKMELTASGVLGKLSTSQMHPSPYKPSQFSLLNLFIFTASWPI